MKFYVLLSIVANIFSDKSHSCDAMTCYDSSLKLYDDMSGSSSINKTFHVCPDTTWYPGTEWDNKTYYYETNGIKGDQPLSFAQSGSKVLCGPNGDLKDNCTLVGGMKGAEAWSLGQEMTDLLIQGFTFTGDANRMVESVADSLSYVDLTIKNCHFVNNSKLETAVFLATDNKHKSTYGATLKIEDCVFENLKMKNKATNLIYAPHSSDISIVRSSFINIEAPNDENPHFLVLGSAEADGNDIDSTSKVSIKDSIFENNENFYSYAAQGNLLEHGSISNNTVDDTEIYCNGIIYFNSLIMKDPKCVSFEEPSAMPTAKPTAMPISFEEPSAMPNAKPTAKLTAKPTVTTSAEKSSGLLLTNKFEKSQTAMFLVSMYLYLV